MATILIEKKHEPSADIKQLFFGDNIETAPPNESLPPGSFFLSAGSKGTTVLPRAAAIKNGIIVGQNGSGKMLGYFAPNCAGIPDTSIAVLDTTGKLWEMTAGFHKNAKRFAPNDPDNSATFNWVPLCSNQLIASLCAEAMVANCYYPHDAAEKYADESLPAALLLPFNTFAKNAEEILLTALFSHAATFDVPTPRTVYRLLVESNLWQLMEQLNNSPSQGARNCAALFGNLPDQMRRAAQKRLIIKLEFLGDPNIERFTSASHQAPDFAELIKTPQAIYFCNVGKDIEKVEKARPLASLFFTILLEQTAAARVKDNHSDSVPLTLLFDEIASVGMIPNLMLKLALTRSHGIAIWIGLTFIEHLDLLYGKDAAEVIFDNCASKIVLTFNGSRPDSINRLIGADRVDEFRRLASDKALIIFQNRDPIVLPKNYFNAKSPATNSGGIMQRLLDCGQVLKSFFFALLIMIILATANHNGKAQTPPSQSLQAGPPVDSVSTNYVVPKRDAFSNLNKSSSAGRTAGAAVSGHATDSANEASPAAESIPWPSFEERLAQWTARCDQARSAGLPVPSITEKFLIEEVYIVGRFDSPDGKGVFLKVKGKPTVALYARAGQRFWDGSVVRIDREQVEFAVVEKFADNKTVIKKVIIPIDPVSQKK